MQIKDQTPWKTIFIILQVRFHVLFGVFGAGSTFALARMSGNSSAQIVPAADGRGQPSLIPTGRLLWFLLHCGPRDFRSMFSASALSSPFSPPASKALAAAAANCAVAAGRGAMDAGVDRHAILDQRLAAACLVVTVTCMGGVPLRLRAAATGLLTRQRLLW